MKNKKLNIAKIRKRDEFYTQLQDIGREMQHYESHFKDKVIYCNCDDPRHSNFFQYFFQNFERLGLKRLIATCYKNQNPDILDQDKEIEKAPYVKYTGEIYINYLDGNGDFRSSECIELLKTADIVITNPPFSLFRDFLAQLIKYDKKFLIVGNKNAITYKKVFPLLKNGEIWLGVEKLNEFVIPSSYPIMTKSYREEGGIRIVKVDAIKWFTNLSHSKRNKELILTKKYTPDEFPRYDNYDAIEVSKVKNIPYDYDGYMGVPITFMEKYNPNQFEIIGQSRILLDGKFGRDFKLNGKYPYMRIVIKHKN